VCNGILRNRRLLFATSRPNFISPSLHRVQRSFRCFIASCQTFVASFTASRRTLPLSFTESRPITFILSSSRHSEALYLAIIVAHKLSSRLRQHHTRRLLWCVIACHFHIAFLRFFVLISVHRVIFAKYTKSFSPNTQRPRQWRCYKTFCIDGKTRFLASASAPNRLRNVLRHFAAHTTVVLSRYNVPRSEGGAACVLAVSLGALVSFLVISGTGTASLSVKKKQRNVWKFHVARASGTRSKRLLAKNGCMSVKQKLHSDKGTDLMAVGNAMTPPPCPTGNRITIEM
jgi:hypothetical protein